MNQEDLMHVLMALAIVGAFLYDASHEGTTMNPFIAFRNFCRTLMCEHEWRIERLPRGWVQICQKCKLVRP